MAVRFTGVPSSAQTTWSVDEDAVPLDMGSSSSGVPQMSVSGFGGNPLGLLGNDIRVFSDDFGETGGTILAVSRTAGQWSVDGGSALSKLVQVGTVRPRQRIRLDQVIANFFEAVNVNASGYKAYFDAELLKKTYDVPASRDQVWVALVSWLAANEIDMAYVIDTLYFTPIRTSTLYLQDVSSDWSVGIEEGQKSRRVNVNIYHRIPFTQAVVYPPRPTAFPDADTVFGDRDNTVITVEAGEVSTTTLQLPAEINSIRTPVQVSSLPGGEGRANVTTSTHPNGCYIVVGKDNKPIMPAQWRDYGGGLSVKLNEDKCSVDVTVSGMAYAALGPYRICESDGEKDYPGLFLVGDSGAFVDVETLRFDTGAQNTDEETSVDNSAIGSRTVALHAAQRVADMVTGHAAGLSWSGPDPVRSGFAGRVRQTFGRIPGVRFFLDRQWWRAYSVGLSDGTVNISADRDPTLADLNRRYTTVQDLRPEGRSLRRLSDEGVF